MLRAGKITARTSNNSDNNDFKKKNLTIKHAASVIALGQLFEVTDC